MLGSSLNRRLYRFRSNWILKDFNGKGLYSHKNAAIITVKALLVVVIFSCSPFSLAKKLDLRAGRGGFDIYLGKIRLMKRLFRFTSFKRAFLGEGPGMFNVQWVLCSSILREIACSPYFSSWGYRKI